jgi:hypothetical protein
VGRGFQQESVILNPSALLAIHPGERYATTNFLEGDFGTGIGLVPTKGLATATGEDRRLAKHAPYYWLLLAESHVTRRWFGRTLQRIAGLSVPAG